MQHPSPCPVCDVVRENPQFTNTHLAKQAGVDEKTVRRHRGYIASTDVDDTFGIPRAAITSRGMSYYDPGKGWEKITYDPKRAALLNLSNYYDDLEQALAATPTEAVPTKGTGNVAVFIPADLQLGKVDRNGDSYGTIRRVLDGVERFRWDCQHTQPSEVVVAELGDLIENFNNTPTQRGTNHMDLTTQVRTARRLLLEVIKRLRACAPQVTLASVPSNHSAVRIEGTKAFASTPGNDWGIEVSHQIEDALLGRDEYAHVRFVRPDSEYSEALTYRAANGVRIGMMHGHNAKTQANVGNHWRDLAFGRVDGLHEADMLLYGHFHNLRLTQLADGRWAIGAASADPGSAWHTNSTGESATAGVTALDVHAERTVPWSSLRIL